MTTKGEKTRRRIVEKAAGVFNTKGYFGSSMTDLVREIGLEKGGIYNHFASKEELALEAFDYAVGTMQERFQAALEGKEGALERLFAAHALRRRQDLVLPSRGLRRSGGGRRLPRRGDER